MKLATQRWLGGLVVAALAVGVARGAIERVVEAGGVPVTSARPAGCAAWYDRGADVYEMNRCSFSEFLVPGQHEAEHSLVREMEDHLGEYLRVANVGEEGAVGREHLRALLAHARARGAVMLSPAPRLEWNKLGGVARNVARMLRRAGVTDLTGFSSADAALEMFVLAGMPNVTRNVLVEGVQLGVEEDSPEMLEHALRGTGISWPEWDPARDKVWVWMESSETYAAAPACGVLLVQVEQWWEPHNRVFDIARSFAQPGNGDARTCPRLILDFAEGNMRAMQAEASRMWGPHASALPMLLGLSSIQQLPVYGTQAFSAGWTASERDIDVLFVGTVTNRRHHVLANLAAKLQRRITVVTEAYDADLWATLRRARVLVNVRKAGPGRSDADLPPPGNASVIGDVQTDLPPSMEFHRLSEAGPWVGAIVSEPGGLHDTRLLSSTGLVRFASARGIDDFARAVLDALGQDNTLRWRAFLGVLDTLLLRLAS